MDIYIEEHFDHHIEVRAGIQVEGRDESRHGDRRESQRGPSGTSGESDTQFEGHIQPFAKAIAGLPPITQQSPCDAFKETGEGENQQAREE